MNLIREVIPNILAVVGVIIVLIILIAAVWAYLIKPMLKDAEKIKLKKEEKKEVEENKNG